MSKRAASKSSSSGCPSSQPSARVNGAVPRDHGDNNVHDDEEEEEDANTRGAHLKLAQRHHKIVTGRFKGLCTVEPEEPAPGVLGQLAICFTTNGALPAESRVTCQLPDHGWSMVATTPASSSVSVNALPKLPQGCAVPSLKSLWTPSTRTLEFTLLGEGIGSDTPVAIIVSGVYTPESATPQGEVIVTAFEKLVVRNTAPTSTRGGQIIDGPCRFTLAKLLPGQLTGSKRWLPFSCSPGAVSDVSLSVHVNGAIPIGGKILIELPADGWDMDERPRVLLRNAQHHNSVVSAVWTREQHALEITVGAGSAGTRIQMKTSLTLTIAGVKNPPQETLISSAAANGAANSARITTLSASGGVIDGPCRLDVARISELRDADFGVARQSFDSEDAEKSGWIVIEKVADVLKRAGVNLSDELYDSLVVANLPVRDATAKPPSDADEATAAASEDGAALQVPPGNITRDEFLNLFSSVYAPAYKFGQELRLACGRGQVDKVREWVSRGCDTNAKDGSGWSALHYAADYGQLDALQTLLEMDADVDASSGNRSGRGRLDLDARDACGWTPLLCAAANGHTRVVERLLEAGASVSLASADGRTALHWAGTRGMDETLQVLLKAMSTASSSSDAGRLLHIDMVDRSGWSVLHCAALHGSSQCAKLLIESGASATLKDTLQYAPAHYGHIESSSPAGL